MSVGDDSVTFAQTDTRIGGEKLISLKTLEIILRLIAHTRSQKPALPFVPVVPARATCFSSHRMPLGFIPGSHSQRKSAYEQPDDRFGHRVVRKSRRR